MWIPMVLTPLLSNEADHHQQWGLLNALLLQQHCLLLEPIEPPNTSTGGTRTPTPSQMRQGDLAVAIHFL